jgi:hypothetical protein
LRCHSVGNGIGEPNAVNNAIGCAKFYSHSHDPVFRVYDAAGNVIETHEQEAIFKNGDFAFVIPIESWKTQIKILNW